jgi:DNA replication and repair protein RecF
MVIKSLELAFFRNYETFSSKFSPGINFIHGRNGQGKTNLIESLYVITHLKSFRTAHLNELNTYSKDASSIKAILTKQNVSHEIDIDLKKNRKKVYLDKKVVGYTSEYIKDYFSILFAPDQLVFFKEYPLERRNFFDRVLVLIDRNYFNLIKDFNKIKKQKGILLRLGRAEEITVWNQLLAENIPKITEARRWLVEKVNVILTGIFSELTGRDDKLELWYKGHLENKECTDEAGVYAFLQEKLGVELKKGFPCYGPHKDQFWMTLNGKKDKQNFSQGENRITFLSLQFAINAIVADLLGFNPVILLDDIFSELDGAVFKKTIDYIYQKDNQVFITSTDIPPEYKNRGSIYCIENGVVLN